MTEPSRPCSSADEQIGAHLRALREAALLSPEDLAAVVPGLGWDAAAVADVEAGRRPLTVRELLTLGRTLGWELDGFAVGVVLVEHDAPSLPTLAAASGRVPAAARAAEALGISLAELDARSRRTWGRTFAQERERRRTALTARRQTLGHVVRQMVAELEEAAERPARRRPLRASPRADVRDRRSG